MHKGGKQSVYIVLKRRAYELYQQDKTQKYIVEALGVSQTYSKPMNQRLQNQRRSILRKDQNGWF